MYSRVLKVALVSSTALLNSITAEAGCISIAQQPVVDQNFNPITLQFNIHVTKKWDGLGVSSAIDQSFIEDITISRAFRQREDFCNSATSISANVASTKSVTTADVSTHVGRDFSLVPAHSMLTSQNGGSITNSSPFGSWTTSIYQLTFSILASAYIPVRNDLFSQYVYADYSKAISFSEFGLEGWQTLDLTSYLQSHIGISGSYIDLVEMINEKHQTLDKYGIEGTATLIRTVTEVPEPESSAILLVGLGMLCALTRCRKKWLIPRYRPPRSAL